jgi:hypothetical protein
MVNTYIIIIIPLLTKLGVSVCVILFYVQEVSDSNLGSETIVTEVFCGLPQAIQENPI